MTNLPPTPLTTTAARARAGAIVGGALYLPAITAFGLVETIDLISAAVLRAAGLDDATARLALAILWEHPVQTAAAVEPRCRVRIADREREFLRDLGQRIHLVRGARRLPAAGVAQATSIPLDQLGDVERGTGVPTVLGLYRLAGALKTPLPLLIDDKLTPIELLRKLASHDQAGE